MGIRGQCFTFALPLVELIQRAASPSVASSVAGSSCGVAVFDVLLTVKVKIVTDGLVQGRLDTMYKALKAQQQLNIVRQGVGT